MPYKWKLNTDIAGRDKIIFGEYDPDAYAGGIRNFEGMQLDTLKKLIEKNFIRAAERQNEAPTTAQILAFMERYPEYTAHGYAVTSKRFDYRVTIEGVSKGNVADTVQELEDFTRLFGNADNFNTGIMDCWFD